MEEKVSEVPDMSAGAPRNVLEGRWELREGPADGAAMTGYGIELVFTEAGATDDLGSGDRGGLPATGSVSGRSGVNRFQGNYWSVAEPQGESGATGILAFGPLAITLMAGPPAAMSAEQAFLEMLDRVRGYRARGAELDLLGDSGELLARLERAQPASVTV